MGQTRTSRTGSEDGYTLAELLVVLAIIALISAISPIVYRSAVPGARMDHAEGQVVDFLREARAYAVANQTETQVIANEAGNRLVASAGVGSVTLPGTVTMRFRPTFEPDVYRSVSITFYPDGGATGGTVVLSEGRRGGQVEVHWLFGHVRRVDG